MRHLITSILLLAIHVAGGIAQNLFGNALIPDMVADASVQQIGKRYYCYATTDGYGHGLETSGPPVVWVSDNFVDWSFSGIYFPSASNQKYWAPSKVVERNGKYYIYPTINGYIYPAVADSPEGPFRIAKGEDRFDKPFTKGSTLIDSESPTGIDAEVFVDDDGHAYIFWGRYKAAKLKDDMVTLDSIVTLPTIHKEYSEGPVFFKRNGIYYYLYTLGGDERYHYAYMMSRKSPLGPWEYPKENIIATTNRAAGVYGPGHGCVFQPEATDDCYFVYLEFGRRSTNRQTYVNRMDFNDDGTIKPVSLNLNGGIVLDGPNIRQPLIPENIEVSSTREPLFIEPMKDSWCRRTEIFTQEFAFDCQNGSRWMPAATDTMPWMKIDLGKVVDIEHSDLYFIRPTSRHRYSLETSEDGSKWKSWGDDDDDIRSPHVNNINEKVRYLKVSFLEGEPGLWEWKVYAQDKTSSPEWGKWQAWGERLDGSYLNPILPADFSDIDCIKVGNDYYAISSTFQFSPGMTLLHSTDLVNWEICSNIVDDITQISPSLNWDAMDRYGRGIWAGTLRWHNGRFYLCFGTPDEGLFVTSASSPQGPWESLTCLVKEQGWDDCTMIWDEKGKPWFAATHFSDNYKTYLWRMSDDAKSLNAKSRRLVNEGSGREASKLIRHNGWYYLVFSEHKDGIGRYVMAKRTKRLSKGFNEERQLTYACRESNEPNQGGIVEGETGKWYFLTHHGTGDWGGREVSLLPVEWRNGWPVIGEPDSTDIGSMVWKGKMPQLPKSNLNIVASDDFNDTSLKPHWHWNYQPRKDYFSLTERRGFLRLKAFQPLNSGELMKAGNTLAQRIVRQAGTAIVKIDISRMADGQQTGLCHFSSHHAAIGVKQVDGNRCVEFFSDCADKHTGAVISEDYIWLKSEWDDDGLSHFSYSTDGYTFITLGTPYRLSWGNYRGDEIGIYTFNNITDTGIADVDKFEIRIK